jgi:biotin operon repressor
MSLSLFERLKYIDFLIRTETTGTPVELGEKLGISVRSVHYYIGMLKELGAEIKFDRTSNTYKNVTDTNLKIGYYPIEKDM